MPNTNNVTPQKKVKDFTAEEKVAISARADRIELTRVAKEFNTTWQVVRAIQEAVHKEAANKKQAKKQVKKPAAPAGKAKKVTAAPAASDKKKAPKLTDADRAAILERATEIGATEAAKEAGISKWTVFQWRKTMKKAGKVVAPIPRRKSAPQAKNTKAPAPVKAPAVAVKKNVVKMPEAPKAAPAPKKSEAVYSSLDFENRLLKEQVAALTKQVEKLRAAVNQLA